MLRLLLLRGLSIVSPLIHVMFNTSICCRRWICLNDRLDEGHQVLEIRLLTHVPSCQVCNSYLVLSAQIVLVLGYACRQLLVNVSLWSFKWESTLQNNFNTNSFTSFGLHRSFENKNICWLHIALKLHALTSWLKRWERVDQINRLLNYEVLILAKVNIWKPFV